MRSGSRSKVSGSKIGVGREMTGDGHSASVADINDEHEEAQMR